MLQRPPDELHLSPDEGDALIERLERNTLSAEDRRALVQVVRWVFWLFFVVQEAQLSLKRLRTLIFGKASRAPQGGGAAGGVGVGEAERGHGPVPGKVSGPQASPAAPLSALGRGHTDAGGVEARRGGHRPGQGRLGAAVYTRAVQVECRHEDLRIGEVCPVCGQGRLYALPPGVEIRIDGNALLSAMRYELEKLRCSTCGQTFIAPLPADAGAEKYSPRARAVLVVSRYYLGVPLYCIEGYQAMLGVPVPDATQWDQIERVADCSYRVFEVLERLAAQGELIYQDDTSVRILTLLAENRALHAHAASRGRSRAPERTGMYTTALVVKVGEHTIYLYYSGRAHAGENLEALLTKREATQEKPLVMSDALHSNDADETTLIRCHCLAHGRRKFSEIEDVFPGECQVVLESLKQVFDHDEEARVTQMSAEERLAYHQVASGPIMEELKRWLQQQDDERLVEPNSSLGKAIAYVLGHWETLTRFLSVPGAPLDNNLVERALKLFIRQRKNSLFYKTEHSAYIASVLTSLIATCLHAGVNALEYLVALQEHRAAVFANPAAWLPWTYHVHLAPP
jgi:transposase